MRVQGFEVEGTAEKWAERWYEIAPDAFVASTVEDWVDDQLKLPTSRVNLDVAHRTADKLLQKGRKVGLWEFRKGWWHVLAVEESS